MEAIIAEGCRRRWGHLSTLCFEQDSIDGVLCRHWRIAGTITEIVRELQLDSDAVLPLFRHLTEDSREQHRYNAEHPDFPCLRFSHAWSTGSGVYFCVNDKLLPYYQSPEEVYQSTILTCWATKALPPELRRLITTFLINPNHLIPPEVATLGMFPGSLNMSHTDLRDVPHFAENLKAIGWLHDYRVACAFVGLLMRTSYHGGVCNRIICQDPEAMNETPFIQLVSRICLRPIFAQDASESGVSVCLMCLGTLPTEEEPNWMGVIRLCSYWYIHRHEIQHLGVGGVRQLDEGGLLFPVSHPQNGEPVYI